MSHTLPLIAHRDAAQALAFRRDDSGLEPVTAAQFIADVQGLAALLPSGRHLLNVCTDRYRFAVGLAAGLIAGKVSLLPSTHTPETVRQLKETAPDVFLLSDRVDENIDLPHFAYPTQSFAPSGTFRVPQIAADALLAEVFTSGSTGLPVPHRKTFGKLVASVRNGARRLGLIERPPHIVGTVPPQHMYGLESTIILPWQTGGAFFAGRPFYPADIAETLSALPSPRMLVTTPVHLRTLLDAELPLSPVDLTLSATAPLSVDLARRAESALVGPLKEIYGCTETGQIATRQPTVSPIWTLQDDITLRQDGDTSIASGPHIEGDIALGDVLEWLGDGQFALHGRHADLINIAGKRTSLAYLNHQLTAIPGVVDGAFFVPDESAVDGVTRLTACVVAPTLDRATLDRALRERIDPIFLPRPLHLVAALPRNATGKLPRPLLREFIAGLSKP
jgi:acyl-coenzyme A synthetase/AMP-(fatty) acid ligase